MHDLRRQALESGKTVSRKARSRQASGLTSKGSSAANSRPASRNASRNPSDEEDGNLSDDTVWSTTSIDELLSPPEEIDTTDAWKAELSDRMEQIIDRKRSSVQGREQSLASYAYILTTQYAAVEIDSKLGELVPAIVRSIKAGQSDRETVLALKALAVTLINSPSDTIYDSVAQTLNRTITDSESSAVKTAGIHTYGTVTFYGGASLDATEDVMAFLLEIVESDGHYVSAGDDGDVVAAAIENWAFLATQIDDLEEVTEPGMEAFVEQLSSSDVRVQVASGEAIALLYEKSYTELEEGEEYDSDESDSEDDTAPGAAKMVQRYTVYPRQHLLVQTLTELAKTSTKGVSKKDRKSLHTNFADILNSVENPTRGPRYQAAINQDTGKRYGSRMTVRINKTGEMRIDKWWKLCRLKALRRVLGGGFVRHYEMNEVVFESLPVLVSRPARVAK